MQVPVLHVSPLRRYSSPREPRYVNMFILYTTWPLYEVRTMFVRSTPDDIMTLCSTELRTPDVLKVQYYCIYANAAFPVTG